MKLASYKLELSVLHAITKLEHTAALQHLSKLTESHFFNEGSKDAYKRIKNLAIKSELPSWSELLDDPVFPDSVKEVLKSFTPKKQKEGFIDRAFEKLEYYRKARVLSDLSEYVQTALSKDKVTIEEVQKHAAEKLSNAVSSVNDQNFFHIGIKDNVAKHVQKILRGESGLYLPSGFDDWDSVNKGIPAAGLTVIGASTGSGKSLVSSQLAQNLASKGYNVCIVPLEMGNEEMLTRWLSNIGDMSMGELMFSDKLPRNRKVELYRKYEELSKKFAKKGGGITYYVPDYSAAFDDIILTLQPFNFHCIIIDYVGLLSDAESGEQQWRSLAQVTRKAHVYGETHGVAMVLNCQVSQDNKIRYAGAIRENAKLAWIWSIPDSSRDENPIKYVTVIPQKSRGQKPITWLMKLDFEHMRASCLTPDEKSSFLAATKVDKKAQTDGLDPELAGVKK